MPIKKIGQEGNQLKETKIRKNISPLLPEKSKKISKTKDNN